MSAKDLLTDLKQAAERKEPSEVARLLQSTLECFGINAPPYTLNFDERQALQRFWADLAQPANLSRSRLREFAILRCLEFHGGTVAKHLPEGAKLLIKHSERIAGCCGNALIALAKDDQPRRPRLELVYSATAP